MIQYTFKTYISGGVEHYVYGEAYANNTVISSQAAAFPDSLLSLVYMDIDAVEPLIQKLNDALWQLSLTQDKQYQQSACALLDDLAPRHIYFQQFRLDWKYRISRAMIFERFTEDVLPRKYLYELPETLRRMQAQIMELFKNVLDIDNGTEAVPRKMAAYYKTAGDHAFRFQPQPVGFELINDEVFTEVLEPHSVYDLIDYHLRECVKREMKMRVCKNCGRYFAITGRTTTEYCNRPFDNRGRTCREVGAIAQWTLSKKDDDVFKDYRREYKKRFARMKAGTLPAEEFYAWSKKARERKKPPARREKSNRLNFWNGSDYPKTARPENAGRIVVVIYICQDDFVVIFFESVLISAVMLSAYTHYFAAGTLISISLKGNVQ